MRVGYLGGSFDPVHHGHLALARACREGASLSRVALVVAGTPPHKPEGTLASAEHRLAMARLAAEGEPALTVDDRETRRPGPSFTLDTVRSLREEHPADELLWIIGGDTVPEISTWREVDTLLGLTRFVIAVRPGHDPDAGLAELADRLGEERFSRFGALVVPMEPVDASSTEVRRRIADGESIEGLVPEPVREYVARHRLYV